MTVAPAASNAPSRVEKWYARPKVVLPALSILVLATALMAREPSTPRGGDPRLSTYSAAPMGARLFHELAKRQGWAVRRETRNIIPRDSSTVFAVLDPTIALHATDAHNILEHVRAGGGLLLVIGAGTDLLEDSLGIGASTNGNTVDPHNGAVRQCENESRGRTGVTDLLRDQATSLWIGPAMLLGLSGGLSQSSATEKFVYVKGRGSRDSVAAPVPSVIGVNFGAGRIVISADPDVLRNDALRECKYGLDVAMVRALAFLQGGTGTPRNSLVFDEYRLGRGANAGLMAVVREYLFHTPSGHAMLQLSIAGLLLLLSAAGRMLPVRDDTHVERRSPLEHVDALARAYVQVGATRTAALRLVRGVRRRVDHRAAHTGNAESDEAFLARVAEAKPVLRADIDTVRGALDARVKDATFTDVGSAIARIEAALTRT